MSELFSDDAWPASEPVESAWGIIANAYGGNWDEAPEDWRKAAERWRDEVWLPSLSHNAGDLAEGGATGRPKPGDLPAAEDVPPKGWPSHG